MSIQNRIKKLEDHLNLKEYQENSMKSRGENTRTLASIFAQNNQQPCEKDEPIDLTTMILQITKEKNKSLYSGQKRLQVAPDDTF